RHLLSPRLRRRWGRKTRLSSMAVGLGSGQTQARTSGEPTMRILALLAASAVLALSVPVAAQFHADPALAQVLASDHREADRVRDQYRHPAETLAFFGVEPGMTVVDFLPAGGWFTRVLVPY